MIGALSFTLFCHPPRLLMLKLMLQMYALLFHIKQISDVFMAVASLYGR